MEGVMREGGRDRSTRNSATRSCTTKPWQRMKTNYTRVAERRLHVELCHKTLMHCELQQASERRQPPVDILDIATIETVSRACFSMERTELKMCSSSCRTCRLADGTVLASPIETQSRGGCLLCVSLTVPPTSAAEGGRMRQPS